MLNQDDALTKADLDEALASFVSRDDLDSEITRLEEIFPQVASKDDLLTKADLEKAIAPLVNREELDSEITRLEEVLPPHEPCSHGEVVSAKALEKKLSEYSHANHGHDVGSISGLAQSVQEISARVAQGLIDKIEFPACEAPEKEMKEGCLQLEHFGPVPSGLLMGGQDGLTSVELGEGLSIIDGKLVSESKAVQNIVSGGGGSSPTIYDSGVRIGRNHHLNFIGATLTENAATGLLDIDFTGIGGVTSVNGQTGTVTLTTADISENTSLYFTEARVRATPLTGFAAAGTRAAIVDTDSVLQAFGKSQKYFNDLSNLAFSGAASDVSGLGEAIDDRVGSLLVAGSNITLTYNDAADQLTIAASGGGGGSPGGSNQEIQYNNSGSFAGSSFFSWDNTSKLLQVNSSYMYRPNSSTLWLGSYNGSFAGDSTVAVGMQAGRVVSSGIQNVFIGYYAGGSLTGGSGNTLIGALAGAFGTPLTNTVGIGVNALQNAANVINGTYIGQNVGVNSTGGIGCLALGNFALAANAADYQVAVGGSALRYVTTSQLNTGIGSEAFPDLLTGAGFNTGLGASVGGLVTGAYGVFLGAFSGVTVSSVDRCIAIGYQAKCSTSNVLVIGGPAQGLINDSYFGNGQTSATPITHRMQNTGASGTNVAGLPFRLCGGGATGNATGGSLILETTQRTLSGSFQQSKVQGFELTGLGSTVIGRLAALATTATDGFVYIPTCAGAPTGTPTAYTGKVAMVYDTSLDRLYIHRGGTWRSALFT